MSMRVANPVMSDRVPDQLLKDCPIHIRKLFDLEAALSCRVSTEFRQEGFCLAVVQPQPAGTQARRLRSRQRFQAEFDSENATLCGKAGAIVGL